VKIPARLQPLVEEGLVDEVIRPLMSGKEAAVFLVRAGGEVVVAKVYKDVKHRSFRQKAGYTEGRKVRNSRQQRAMEKGSKYGREQAEEAWHNAEVDALFRMSNAGVAVPKPHVFSDGVLLMDLVTDANGDPAPRLWDVDLSEAEATATHATLMRQAVRMLCAGMVHGDLSEYNVLISADGPIVIDFPQATEAAVNPNAKRLFLRDVHGLTAYLARFAPALAATHYGEEIWEHFERARLTPETELTGKWRGATRKADTRAVLDEIETAARDARDRWERDAGERRGKPRAEPKVHIERPKLPSNHNPLFGTKGLHRGAPPANPEPPAKAPQAARPSKPTPPRARPHEPAPRSTPDRAAPTPSRAIDLDALDALLSED